MAGFFGKMKNRLARKQTRPGLAPEAHEVQSAAAISEPDEKNPDRLLVVGRESAFSEDVVNYALDMAQRLSYDILALNTAPLSCETFKVFSSTRNKICEDFSELSMKNVQDFARQAARRNIPFEHVIKFSDTDQAINEIRKEKDGIEFVIAEPEEARMENRPGQEVRPRQEICVYSMI